MGQNQREEYKPEYKVTVAKTTFLQFALQKITGYAIMPNCNHSDKNIVKFLAIQLECKMKYPYSVYRCFLWVHFKSRDNVVSF